LNRFFKGEDFSDRRVSPSAARLNSASPGPSTTFGTRPAAYSHPHAQILASTLSAAQLATASGR
jgi:hypothetical protein